MLLSATSTVTPPVASETGVKLSDTEVPLPLAQLTARLPPERGLFSTRPSDSVGETASVIVADSPLARLSIVAPPTIFSQPASGTDAVTLPLYQRNHLFCLNPRVQGFKVAWNGWSDMSFYTISLAD